MFYKIENKYKHKVENFMDEFVFENKFALYKYEGIDELVYLIKEFGDEFYNIKKKKRNKLTHQVISHSSRVVNNMMIILKDLINKGDYFDKTELYSMYIAAMFHDVGKIITKNDINMDDDDHACISYLMMKYILDKDLIRTSMNFSYDIILEMIYTHSNKTKYRDQISIYDKILCDADLFDELCGDSLFELLRNKVRCINNNLNEFDYSESKDIIKSMKSSKTKEYVYRRINIESNKELYEYELKRAFDMYYEYFYRPKLNVSLNDIYQSLYETSRKKPRKKGCLYIEI